MFERRSDSIEAEDLYADEWKGNHRGMNCLRPRLHLTFFVNSYITYPWTLISATNGSRSIEEK